VREQSVGEVSVPCAPRSSSLFMEGGVDERERVIADLVESQEVPV
jgi:hypothetical protein